MQQLPERINPAALGRLRLRLFGVLRAPGGQRAPEQATSSGDAGGYRALSWRAEPPRHPGIRQAEIGETPLSVEEIAHGRHIGEIQ